VVKSAWERDLTVLNPFLRPHTKLQRTGKALRAWSRKLIGNNKVLCTTQLIGVLDVVQDFRQLSASELSLKRDLKARLLGMTTVEKLRVRIRGANANEKLFYLHANGRRRKNNTQSLETQSGVCFAHEEKMAALYQHFSSHFRRLNQRDFTLNWDELNLQ
jgi:hypothetical protein